MREGGGGRGEGGRKAGGRGGGERGMERRGSGERMRELIPELENFTHFFTRTVVLVQTKPV